VHPEDKQQSVALFEDCFARRVPFRIEFRLRRRDGAWRWMLSSGAPRHDADGAFIGFIGSCVDITELKEAEAQRQRDLEEKAALLQELHHRVKNNAQVFASLLGVQAYRATDSAVQTALRAAAARASTMAIAQQQIHDSGASANFDLAAFVRRLIARPNTSRVQLELEAPCSVRVPLSTAVPLALIVHELLTNAMQHAFPSGEPGRVTIGINRREGRLCLKVRDNGVGLPDGADLDHLRSAGLTIVKGLVRQLGATLSFLPGPGTAVCIRLPVQ
jgi:two-component sensor histidine kinase